MYALYLALYHGLFGLLLALIAARRNGFSLRALVFTPFVWVAVELARTYITGFPWDLLGTTQIDNIPLSRVATVTGVYGISFEIVLVNTAVAAAFLVPRERRKVLLTASLAAAIVSTCREAGASSAAADRPGSHAGAGECSHPRVPSDWTLDYLTQTLDSLAALSVRPEHSQPGTPGLILWPESPAPFFATDLHVRSTLANVARATDSYIIAGTLGIDHAGDPTRQPDIYNSASVIAPNGAWTARYDKIHLVPFGEYVPFEKLFSFANGLTQQVGTFARGKSRMPLQVGDTKVGTFICYEAVFPDEIRQFARNGAEVVRQRLQRRLVWRGRRAVATPEPGPHAGGGERSLAAARHQYRHHRGDRSVRPRSGRGSAQPAYAVASGVFAGAKHHVLHAPRRLVPVAVCDNHLAGAAVACCRSRMRS